MASSSSREPRDLIASQSPPKATSKTRKFKTPVMDVLEREQPQKGSSFEMAKAKESGQTSVMKAKRSVSLRSLEGPSPERGSGQDRFRHLMAGRPFVPGSTAKIAGAPRLVNPNPPAPVMTSVPANTQGSTPYTSYTGLPGFATLVAKTTNEPLGIQTEPMPFGRHPLFVPYEQPGQNANFILTITPAPTAPSVHYLQSMGPSSYYQEINTHPAGNRPRSPFSGFPGLGYGSVGGGGFGGGVVPPSHDHQQPRPMASGEGRHSGGKNNNGFHQNYPIGGDNNRHTGKTDGCHKTTYTAILSSECQKRRFNPQFIEWQTPEGLYQASVNLNGKKLIDSRTFRTAADAKQALARRAVEHVRTLPIPAGLPNRASEIAKEKQDQMDRERQKEPLRPADNGRGYTDEHRLRAPGIANGMDRHPEDTHLLECLQAKFGRFPSLDRGILEDPLASRAFLEGLALGSRLHDAARHRERRRSQSPVAHDRINGPGRFYRERSPARSGSTPK